MAPTIAERHSQGDRAGLQKSLRTSALLILAYVVPAVIGLLAFSRWGLALFGKDFTGGMPALCVLSISQLCVGLCGPVGFAMQMTGHQDEALKITTLSAGIAIILHLTLIPRFGALGAASATLAATLFRSVALVLRVRTRLRVNSTLLPLLDAKPEAI